MLTDKKIIETLEKILRLCCEVYGVEINDVQSKSKKRRLSDCRKVYILIAVELFFKETSFTAIGKVIRDNYSHATTIGNYHDSLSLLQSNKPFRQLYDDCIKTCRAENIYPRQDIAPSYHDRMFKSYRRKTEK